MKNIPTKSVNGKSNSGYLLVNKCEVCGTIKIQFMNKVKKLDFKFNANLRQVKTRFFVEKRDLIYLFRMIQVENAILFFSPEVCYEDGDLIADIILDEEKSLR